MEKATEATPTEAIKLDLHYDPETGVFRRLRGCSSNARRGEIAGHVGASGYRKITVRGITYRANRLAVFYMTGKWPDHLVDHINGDRGDDRWENLREATKGQNRTNAKVSKNSRSGRVGIAQRGNRWRVRLGGRQYLGSFATFAEAKAVYDAAAKAAYGNFRRAL